MAPPERVVAFQLDVDETAVVAVYTVEAAVGAVGAVGVGVVGAAAAVVAAAAAVGATVAVAVAVAVGVIVVAVASEACTFDPLAVLLSPPPCFSLLAAFATRFEQQAAAEESLHLHQDQNQSLQLVTHPHLC